MTDRRQLFDLARRAKLTVGEFIERTGPRSLAEMSYRVAIAEDLDMHLDDLGKRMNARELVDWIVLYEVEAEARAIEARNASRRQGA